jgi:hypothetical protein
MQLLQLLTLLTPLFTTAIPTTVTDATGGC